MEEAKYNQGTSKWSSLTTTAPPRIMGKLKSKTAASPLLLFSFSSLAFFSTALVSSSSAAPDSLDRAGSVRDGEILVSADGWFELGFFTPGGGSTKRYLCVRFNKGGQEKPIVWVANREQPLHDSPGVLMFGADGNLVVLDRLGGTVFWSTELRPNANGSRVAQLPDSGNLVVRGTDGGVILWQSFDEPGDTLLPGMRLLVLVNTKTGVTRHLTSWATPDDPSPGKYSYVLEVDKLPRFVLREGSTITSTAGLWNGVRFTGLQPMNSNDVFNTSVVSSCDGEETYYTDTMIGNSSLVRLRLEPSGGLERLVWSEETRTWSRLWPAWATCKRFAICGPYSTCVEDSFPYCQCLRGFRPKSEPEWSLQNGTGGCVRRTRLSCGGGGHAFLPVPLVRLPELDNSSTVTLGMRLEECRDRCAGDCSCTAYAVADARRGTGCITWSGDLLNIWNLRRNDQELYLRVAVSDLVPTVASDFRRKKSKLPILASVSAVSVIILLLLYGFWMKRKIEHKTKTGGRKSHDNGMVDATEMELRVFDFKKIILATNNLSIDNKIGEGGFGTVYKGTMEDGQEVAVKRLSCTSVQGVGEFVNEAKLMVKLQHKNLVRLLGCCIQEDERMLIFEYLQNKSLDLYIFDETKRGLLGWRTRLNIILGTARGLLYLHHDSRFKIIHRDLKAGNILLDGEMNPKIADFGTARIFGMNQLIEKTKRVIGTYGHMSPEYAINGIFSVKSDVFSFGVLVLEVLSGIRSRGIYETGPHLNLLSHAWKIWQEGKCLELLDPLVMSSSHEIELLRYIQVGLLCVQEHATNRPTISEVVMMLSSENFPLPKPRKPGFLLFRSPHSAEASRRQEPPTTNEMTITILFEGR